MFTLYRISFCAGTQLEQVAHARQTSTTSCRSDWSREFGEIIPIPIMNIYISSYPLPSLSEYLFTLHQSVVQNLFNMSRSTFEIGTAQLRSVTKMATKSLLLRVNRIPIRYDFRAGAMERRRVTSRYHGSTISG